MAASSQGLLLIFTMFANSLCLLLGPWRPEGIEQGATRCVCVRHALQPLAEAIHGWPPNT